MKIRTALQWGFGLATAAALAALALYLSAVLFLVVNKRNPLDIKPRLFSAIDYAHAYADDPVQAKRLKGSAAVSALLCLVVIPAAGFGATRKRRPLHGAARFARPGEIQAAGLFAVNGIVVGKLGSKFLTFGGQQFVMLAAPTRSGKDVGVVIPNLLSYAGSVVVNDIKGELWAKTAGYRAERGHQVFRFAPFDEDSRTHRWNPLGYVRNDPRFRVADILSIGQVLYPNDGQTAGSEGFFNDQARNLFLGLALYLIDTPHLPRTIGQLLRVASGVGRPLKDELQAIVASRATGPRPLGSDTTEALSRFLSNPDNTLGSILSTFNAPLTIFADPLVDAATSSNDFSLHALRRRRMGVYLQIPTARIKDARLLLNLFFTQTVYLNTQTLPEHDPTLQVECLLAMNEFTALGRVGILAESVGYLAGYNLRLLTVVQSMSQLAAVYGERQARNFATNHALRILYAPQENEDAREYSEMLGTYTEQAESRSRNRSHSFRGGGSSTGTNTSDQRRALMLPQELREMGADQEIVSLERCKPIQAHKIRYYDDPAFMDRLRPAPTVPALDWARYRAGVEGRTRELSEDEAQAVELDHVSGDFSDLPPIHNGATDDEVRAFVDGYFSRLEARTDAAAGEAVELDAEVDVLASDALDPGAGFTPNNAISEVAPEDARVAV